MAKLRILLAEDHAMVRDGLKLLIGAQPDMEVVGEAADGREVCGLASQLQPDIVVMDVSMPRLNGMEATEKLKKSCPETKVLTLTRHTDTAFVQQIFRAGASGYVLKQSASTELVRAIRTIATGAVYLDPAIAGKVMNGYAGRQIKPKFESQPNLSEREEEVLKMVAWGYSNKEIAGRFDISVKTVEAHKANAMKKLGFQSRIEVVRYAILKSWLKET